MDNPANGTDNTDIVDITLVSRLDLMVCVYSTLFVLGAVGNLIELISLVRTRRRKSRVNLLMTHLVVADMAVIFIVIPLEIGWRITDEWLAGNIACKILLVLRVFGFYLSSNVLVCISLDRFFAILYPLRISMAKEKSKIMLYTAWVIALLCSLPQSLVFRVLTHPEKPDFEQCVSFHAFANQQQELAYNVFCLFAMYFLPLIIITVCYTCVLYTISKKSNENSGNQNHSDHNRVMLRRSDQRPLVRARRRTLRMTLTIVSVYACCWMPYAIMTLWYMIDRTSALLVSAHLQDLFFVMAVSNSCMDPLVYGSYTIKRKSLAKTFRKLFCIHDSPSEIPVIQEPDVQGIIPIQQRSIDTSQHNNIRASGRPHHAVRFEESSAVQRAVYSDTIQYGTVHSAKERTVEPTHTDRITAVCHIYTLTKPQMTTKPQSEESAIR